jgi:hypothetical protein
LVVGVVGDGALDEGDLAAGFAEFFEKKNLVSVSTGQAIGAEDSYDIELALTGSVAEAIQARPVQACPGVALIGEDVFGAEFVPL